MLLDVRAAYEEDEVQYILEIRSPKVCVCVGGGNIANTFLEEF